MNPSRKQKLFGISLTAIWMAVIFALSHQPAEQSSELSGSLLSLVLSLVSLLPVTVDAEWLHFFVRKTAHFTAYFILGVLVDHTVRLFFERRSISFVLASVISILYAISDEYHQTFIPGRSGEVRDVIIDGFGALCGIFVYRIIHYVTIKAKKPD